MPNVRHGSTVLAALFAIPLWACGAPKTPVHLATATSASASASASATLTPPRPPCEIAADQRARVPKLLEAGKLDRTVRVIEHADTLCPSTAPTTWAVLVTTLIELGRFDDANKVVVQIEASKSANVETQSALKKAKEFISQHKSEAFSEDAKAAAGKAYQEGMDAELAKNLSGARAAFVRSWSLYRPNGQALFAAGLVATALGQPAEAQRLLDRAVVELEQREGKKVVLDTPNGFPGGIQAIALQKNAAPGKAALLAVATGNDVVIINTITWRETMRLVGHSREVSRIAFHPDGKRVASRALDRSIRMWDIATGAQLLKLEIDSELVVPRREWGRTPHAKGNLVFSPDGLVLAWDEIRIRVNTAGLWRVFSDTVLYDLGKSSEWRRHMDVGWPIEFVGNRRLALGAGGVMRLIDIESGVEQRVFHSDPYVTAASVSADGRSLAAAVGDKVRIWDIATGRKTHELVTSLPTDVAFLTNNRFAVSSGEGVSIWALNAGAQLQKRGFAKSSVLRVFSGDAKSLVGSDLISISSWDVLSGDYTARVGSHTPKMYAISFSGDGKSVASASGMGIQVWSISSGTVRQFHREFGSSGHLAFSPDSETLVGGNSESYVHLWDVASGHEVHLLRHIASSAAISPDGTAVVTASTTRDSHHNHDIRFWELATGLETNEIAPGVKKRSGQGPIAFAPDGKSVWAAEAEPSGAFGDRALSFWHVNTGKAEILRGPATSGPIVFSPDGKLIALTPSKHGTVELWELSSSSRKDELVGHTDTVSSLAFARDGALLASASADKTVRLWDVARHVETRVLAGHTGAVNSVAFSPNGKLIGSASSDGSLRFWSTKGEPLLVVRSVDDSRPEWKDKLASYAFTTSPSPLIEFLGPDADGAREFPVCRVGPRTFPFALCRERVEVPGLFAKVLAGDMSYLDP